MTRLPEYEPTVLCDACNKRIPLQDERFCCQPRCHICNAYPAEEDFNGDEVCGDCADTLQREADNE